MTAERELFDRKWPIVQRAVKYHCRRRRLRAQDTEDIAQEAALALCGQCRRAGQHRFEISCQVIARAGWQQWKRKRLNASRTAPLSEDSDLDTLPAAGETAIIVDDVAVTLCEVRLDAPKIVSFYEWVLEEWICAAELARQLGLCRQNVSYRPHRRGAIKIAGRWLFPPDAGLTATRPRKNRKPSRESDAA